MLFNQGYIDQKEYEQNSKLGIKTINNDEKPSFNYVYLAKKDLDKIINDFLNAPTINKIIWYIFPQSDPKNIGV